MRMKPGASGTHTRKLAMCRGGSKIAYLVSEWDTRITRRIPTI